MLSKVCAVWIVVLIILPFTAPLSSVTLEELMPRRGGHDGLATSSSSRAAEVTHPTVSHTTPVPVPEGRFLTRLHGSSVVVSLPLPERTPPGVPPRSDRSSAIRSAVLRI
jgi:hypothetical protein